MIHRRRLPLILGLYVVLALGYSLLVPPWEAPDETAHYLVAYHLAQDGEMPTVEQTYESVQPPAYYWLAAGALRFLEAVDPDLTVHYRPPLTPQSDVTRYGWNAGNYRFLWGMQVLRWINVGLGALALFFIALAVRRLQGAVAGEASVPASVLAPATVALVALTPQFIHNTAAVSNDALANAAGAFLFWILVILALAPPQPWQLVSAAAAAVALPVLVKLTILPMSAAVLLVLAWRARQQHGRLLLAVLGLSLLALGAGLWWLAPSSARFLWRTFWWRVTYVRPTLFEGWPLSQILAYYAAGYWGQIGWKTAALPGGLLALLWSAASLGSLYFLHLLVAPNRRRTLWRRLFFVVALATAVGFLLQRAGNWWQLPWTLPVLAWALLPVAWWRRRTDRVFSTPAWWAVWLAGALAVVMVFRNALVTPQFQARFLFPALGPLALTMVAGWAAFLPERAARALPYVIVVAFLALTLFFWADTVIPGFYQPFLDG